MFDRLGLALQQNPSRRQSGIKAPVEAYHKRRAAFDDVIDCRIGKDRGLHSDRSTMAARQPLGRGGIDIDDRAKAGPGTARDTLRVDGPDAPAPNRQKLIMIGPSAIVVG